MATKLAAKMRRDFGEGVHAAKAARQGRAAKKALAEVKGEPLASEENYRHYQRASAHHANKEDTGFTRTLKRNNVKKFANTRKPGDTAFPA